eukprot:TCONS_00018471-protein
MEGTFLSNMFWMILCFILIFNTAVSGRRQTPEERLHSHLFGDQHHDLTAFPLEKGSLDLNFRLKLFGADIETDTETLSVDVNFIQSWANKRLSWNPMDFGNITDINIDPEAAWVPNLYVHGNLEEDKEYNGLLSTLLTKINLRHDGVQTWLAPSTLLLKCAIIVSHFPFDTQHCHLQFGSFAFDSSKLNINVKPLDLDLYEDSPEWELLESGHAKEYVTYPGSKTPYTDALYVLKIRRKALAPLKELVFPNLALITLTMLVFVIPTDAGERIGYLFTTFLAIAFFMTDTIDTLPRNSLNAPFCMVFMGVSTLSLSLLAVCLCISISCYYANTNLVKLPDKCKTFLRKSGKFLGVNLKREFDGWRHMLNEIRNFEEENFIGSCSSGSLHEEVKKFALASHTEHPTERAKSSPEQTPVQTRKDNSQHKCSLSEEEIDGVDPLFENPEDLRSVHERLEILLSTFEEQDDSSWREMEWFLFSQVVDKICFVVFTSYFVLSLVFAGIHIYEVY